MACALCLDTAVQIRFLPALWLPLIGIEKRAPSVLMQREEVTSVDRELEQGSSVVVPRLQLTLRLCAKRIKQAPNQTRLARVISPPQQILPRMEVHVPRLPVAMREQPDVFEAEAFHSS
jgi:hypothetical protein